MNFCPSCAPPSWSKSAAIAEDMAREQSSAITFPHPRWHLLSRPHDQRRPRRRSRPLALKRELRLHEGEVVRLARVTTELPTEQARIRSRNQARRRMAERHPGAARRSRKNFGRCRHAARSGPRRTRPLRASKRRVPGRYCQAPHRNGSARKRPRPAQLDQAHVDALSARETAESEAAPPSIA